MDSSGKLLGSHGILAITNWIRGLILPDLILRLVIKIVKPKRRKAGPISRDSTNKALGVAELGGKEQPAVIGASRIQPTVRPSFDGLKIQQVIEIRVGFPFCYATISGKQLLSAIVEKSADDPLHDFNVIR